MSRPQSGLNARFVETVQPPATGRKDYFDDKVRGLCLRVWRHGKGGVQKRWSLFYRNAEGTQRRYTIGTVTKALGLEAARKQAQRLKRDIDLGGDPAAEKEEARKAEEQDSGVLTIRKVAAEFREICQAAPAQLEADGAHP